MAFAWTNIAADETKVNAPDGQTLNDKYRGNLDNIRARVRDTPTDANWVTQNHIKNNAVGQGELKTVIVDEAIQAATSWLAINDGDDIGQYGFWPTIKSDNPASGQTWGIHHSGSYLAPLNHNVLTGTHDAYVWMNNSGATWLRAKWYAVTASRDFPLMFIQRNKTTEKIYNMGFRPEGQLENHPYIYSEFEDGSKESDMEILCLQLKHDKKLCEYLIKNYFKFGFFTEMIEKLILSNEIELKNTTIDPMLPEKTNKTDDYKAFGWKDPGISPVLHKENIKLVNWEFKLK